MQQCIYSGDRSLRSYLGYMERRYVAANIMKAVLALKFGYGCTVVRALRK